MSHKILKSPKSNRKKLKFYFPTKISWNPFTWLDKKAKKIPKNVALAVIFLTISFYLLKEENTRRKQGVLGLQTQVKAEQKLAFDWEQILAQRPDYRDGWIQLTAIYYQLGNQEKAKEALQKAKKIDPLNTTILSLEKLLGN